MTDRRDDDFRVRPSAPKNRGKGQGQSFVSKVLKQAGKASGGKSVVRHSAASGGRASARPTAAGAGGGTLRRGKAHADVAARDHQDAAGQPAQRQPAVARTCATSSATVPAAMASRAALRA